MTGDSRGDSLITVPMASLSSSRERWAPYVWAVAIAVASMVMQWALRPWVGERVPFLFVLPALMFVALVFGRGPALVVMGAGAANAILMAPPAGSFTIDHPEDLVALGAYLVLASLLVFHGGRMRLTTATALRERERAQAMASENERRFAVTLESSVVPFSIIAPLRDDTGRLVDFRWTYANPAGAAALGRNVAQLLGQRVSEVMPTAWNAPGLLERYVGVVERGESFQLEVRTKAIGKTTWLHIIASPLDGGVAVWFADITERKRQELALKDADRRKDEFLATLAHELRNPLAPIRQAVLIARLPSTTPAQKEWSHEVIDRQARNMALLLDDLLDISRITRGTLLLRKSPATLAAMLDVAVETARPHLEAQRHALTLDVAPLEPLEVDPLRMAQVLGNLLTNAAKYTDPGGCIRVVAGREGRELVIRVADNGIGMTQEQRAQLFEMFSQLPTGKDRAEGGLGIGLALSRGLVELHGGHIDVQSDGPGRGSVFTVRLPDSCFVKPAAEPVPLAVVAVPSREDRGLRVLVADDNRDAADTLAELLRMSGHQVHLAYDGEQALAEFTRVHPDAALLDVAMPGMNGHDVARAIRSLPGGERAFLVAITGWGQEQDRNQAFAAGFNHHTTKPMNPEHVIALLQDARGAAP
jgi:PAS domain S-box-containing protein